MSRQRLFRQSKDGNIGVPGLYEVMRSGSSYSGSVNGVDECGNVDFEYRLLSMARGSPATLMS